MTAVSRRDETKKEEIKEEGILSEHEEPEDYVAGFMDKALVTDWDKLNSKVCSCKLYTYVVQ